MVVCYALQLAQTRELLLALLTCQSLLPVDRQ